MGTISAKLKGKRGWVNSPKEKPEDVGGRRRWTLEKQATKTDLCRDQQEGVDGA